MNYENESRFTAAQVIELGSRAMVNVALAAMFFVVALKVLVI